jgi:peptidoglycan/xylan/chitin deacetylase (PgdA/CDA1 family)
MHWKRDKSIVPVLMFHSVGRGDVPWVWSELSERLETFEEVLAGLLKKGFRSVRLSDLHDHMSGLCRLPDNSIVLTFDDGYLDNWVYVVPLLRKYGMSGTVYVTPEFVQSGNEIRPNMDDHQRPNGASTSTAAAGFMNWEELRSADSEGILDVQCHALTHTWYFSGPRVVDIHRPRAISPYPWLFWNARPDRKPHYLTEQQQEFVAWGQPVFEHEKSLIVRKFTPEPTQADMISDFVRSHGGADFFEQNEWRTVLTSRFPVLLDSHDYPGNYESVDDYRERVFQELSTSREILERELGKPVEFLSWPGGGVNEMALQLAKQAGFKSWTLSSWLWLYFCNRPGVSAFGIKRVSGHSRVYWRNNLVKVGDPSWIVLRVLTHQGSLVSKIAGVFRKLGWIVASALSCQPDRKDHPDASR